MSIDRGENYYRLEAGAGGDYADADLAQICATGSVQFDGAIARLAVNTPVGGVAEAPRISYEVDILGGGLYGYTFTVRGHDGQQAPFFADVTFQGAEGGQIRQMPFVGYGGFEYDVETEAAADVLDGRGSPAYDRYRDSWAGRAFTDAPAYVVMMESGANSYHVKAGTGPASRLEQAELAYIVASGPVAVSGYVVRLAERHPISATAGMPNFGPAAGDVNWDNVVDGGDYTIWSDHYGLQRQTWRRGDMTGDGRVDGLDYTLWSDNYLPAGGLPAVPAGKSSGGYVAADQLAHAARAPIAAAAAPAAPHVPGGDSAGDAERLRHDPRPALRTPGRHRPSPVPAVDALDLLEAPDLAVLPADAV